MLKKTLFGIFMVCLWGFIACQIVSCSQCNNYEDQNRITDYGNGVYYFEYRETKFTAALSKFIKEHPELLLISAVGDGNGTYGRDQGYTVVFRSK